MRTCCRLFLFVIILSAAVVAEVNPDMECRCDYEKHEGEVSFVCFDKHDQTFVEERKCPAVSQERPCEATLFRSCSGQTNCYAEDRSFAYGDWVDGCKFPEETVESLALCKDRRTSNNTLVTQNVMCTCSKQYPGLAECYGPDGCLFSRNECYNGECLVPSHANDSNDTFPFESLRDACPETGPHAPYHPIPQEADDQITTLQGRDAYYFCLRPGEITCQVTNVAEPFQEPNYSLGFGVFNPYYSSHRGPFHRKILKRGLVMGDTFSASIDDGSWGLILDMNTTRTSKGLKWDVPLHSRQIFSDDYLNANADTGRVGFSAVHQGLVTNISFIETANGEHRGQVVVQMSCTGLRPLALFEEDTNMSDTTGCQQEAKLISDFRDTIWPPYIYFSKEELQRGAIYTMVAGCLSFCGSAFVAFALIYRWTKFELTCTRDRLHLGLSCTDLLSSLAFSLGPIPSPPEHASAAWNFGTPGTCAAQGFGIQIGFAAPLYISSLCFFYFMVLVLHQDQTSIGRVPETVMHAIPIFFGLFTAIMGVVMNVFGTNGRICWIATSPYDCFWNDIIDCLYGPPKEKIQMYMIGFGLVPVTIAFVVIGLTMISIIVKTVIERRESIVVADHLRMVSVQALLYIMAFLLTYVWLFPVYLAQYTTLEIDVWIHHMNRFFWPLQGFWNFFIFVRPVYERVRKKFPRMWFFQAWAKAMKLESTEANLDELGNPRMYRGSNKRNSIILNSLRGRSMNSRFSSADSFDFRSVRSKTFQISSKDLDLGGSNDGDDSGSDDERNQQCTSKDIDLGTSDENDDSGSDERSQAIYSS